MAEAHLAKSIGVGLSAERAAGSAMKRVKNSADFIGAVGLRQGIPLLLERTRRPNSSQVRTINIKELEHPFSLTAAHSDLAMVGAVIGTGLYDLDQRQSPKVEDNLIIDLGANIGVSAALFASRYRNSPVIAIEPHPRNMELLRENALSYGGQILAVERAVSLHPGKVGLANADIEKIGHHAAYEFNDSSSDSGIWANAITPDELMELAADLSPKDSKIGLLKMNIEGAEKSLLASRQLDGLLSVVNVAIIEAHDQKAEGASAAVLAAASRTGLTPVGRDGNFHFLER